MQRNKDKISYSMIDLFGQELETSEFFPEPAVLKNLGEN
jgi:hypothetical protein